MSREKPSRWERSASPSWWNCSTWRRRNQEQLKRQLVTRRTHRNWQVNKGNGLPQPLGCYFTWVLVDPTHSTAFVYWQVNWHGLLERTTRDWSAWYFTWRDCVAMTTGASEGVFLKNCIEFITGRKCKLELRCDSSSARAFCHRQGVAEYATSHVDYCGCKNLFRRVKSR